MIDRACISLNNNCNFKCKYCHFLDKQTEINSFNYSEVKRIIDNIIEYINKNNICKFKLGIVGSGEPMLKSSIILELLAYIKEKEFHKLSIYTVTNGSLLTRDLLQKFYEYGDLIKLCISLDGYETIHNYGRARYDEVLAAIMLYKEIYGETPSINATVNKISYLNKEKVLDFFLANGFNDVTFSKLVAYKDNDLFITDEQFKEFLLLAKDKGMNLRQFRKEKTYDCTMYGSLCGVGRTNIFITPEGVYPCGRFYRNDKYLLGNSQDSIFNIEKAVNNMTPVEDGHCYYEDNVEGK